MPSTEAALGTRRERTRAAGGFARRTHGIPDPPGPALSGLTARGRSRATLPLLFSIVAVDLIGFGIVLPVLPFLADKFGASAFVLGTLLTSYALMQALFAPIWGRLSDRFGRRPIMLLTITGTSASLLMLGLADSLPGIFAARILAGIFAANVSVASAYVTDVTSEDERTRWLGMIGASYGVGFVIGPAIGGVLAPFGFGVPMLAAAALSALNLVYAAFALREPERHLARDRASPGTLRVLGNSLVRRICSGYFGFSLAMTQLETTFAYYMMDRFGYGTQGVAAILVFMALIMIGVQGGGLRALVPRFGEKRLVLFGTGMLALCIGAEPFMPWVALLLVPLGLSSIARGISQPALMGMVSKAAGEEARGAVMGAFQSSASLARVVGPVIAGLLYDLWQPSPFLLAAVVLAVVFGVSAGLPVTPAAPPKDLEQALDARA